MMTLRAFPTGVARVHGDQWNASKPSLVFQECPELEKRPRMQNCSLLSASRYPVTNALQVFDGNSATGALSSGNDLLGNAVIHVRCEAPFFPAEFVKFSPRTASLFLLKFGSKFPVAESDSSDSAARIVATVRIARNLDHSEIDSEPVVYFLQGWFHGIAGYPQKPLSTMVDEIRFPLPVSKQGDLARASDIKDGLPTLKRPDAYSTFLEAQNAVVIGDSPSLSEFPFAFLVQLVGICDLGKNTDSQLGTQAELILGRMVENLLEGEILEHFSAPGFATKPVRAFITAIEGCYQGLPLIASWTQFNFCYKLQDLKYIIGSERSVAKLAAAA